MYHKLYVLQILLAFLIFNHTFVILRKSLKTNKFVMKSSDYTNNQDYSTASNLILLTKNEIDNLINERDILRFQKQYMKADEIKAYLEKYNIEITDVSYKQGGKSIWNYKLKKIDTVQTNLMDTAHNSYKLLENCSQDILVKEVMDMIKLQYYTQLDNNDNTSNYNDDSNIEDTRIEVMNTSIEMQGRKYADAAFEFSLSGIKDKELFDLLANCSLSELQRFGHRSTCKTVNILQMIEKLAVAGIRNHPIYNEAYRILQSRGVDDSILLQLKPEEISINKDPLTISNYSLFSDRPLLWLWRYASKQKKPTSNSKSIDLNTINNNDNITTSYLEESTRKKIELPLLQNLFKDTSLPLIIDLGCGYGVSLLNMCDQYYKQTINKEYNSKPSSMCNFLGIDLSHRSISYANGISNRWGYQGYCIFQYCDCLNAIDWIEQYYPGPIALILINFPTPYNINNACIHTRQQEEELSTSNVPNKNEIPFIENNLLLSTTNNINTTTITRTTNDNNNDDNDIAGNSQLPDSFDNFMCSPLLINKIYKLLSKSKQYHPESICSLLLQSNVEDVAVTMYNIVNYINIRNNNHQEQFLLPDNSFHANEIIHKIFQLNTSSLLASSITNNVLSNDHETISLMNSFVSLNQLEASTNTSYGGGRLSQRLQIWLNDIISTNPIDNNVNCTTSGIMINSTTCNDNSISSDTTITDIINSKNDNSNHTYRYYNNNEKQFILPRRRAYGKGWLRNSPLPYNTRTETEVHCKLEAKPVHRVLFYFK